MRITRVGNESLYFFTNIYIFESICQIGKSCSKEYAAVEWHLFLILIFTQSLIQLGFGSFHTQQKKIVKRADRFEIK